jgi:hypothetical protein
LKGKRIPMPISQRIPESRKYWGRALIAREMEEIESFSLLVKPPAMVDGAVFKFGRKMRPYRVKMNTQYQTWDGRTLRADVEVPINE